MRNGNAMRATRGWTMVMAFDNSKIKLLQTYGLEWRREGMDIWYFKNAVPARTNIRPGLDVTRWMICKTLRAYAGRSNGVVGYACINYESIYACCSRHYAKLYSTTKLP
jgi:hypothetical protein